ncbi:hypothetical protein CEUSTIGMA_g8622.t1 [Chlamydomonas eustigma]|uniref:Acid phosphatase n=1 Tax=Chlamydomonas eustigma TaxID=1157962 RepID=A0A250XE52_9CHLO|nr:hypothetical protein CEUSTIGMA_g8622.t1 [Chlamydomonas eustigma]|eukprot:GAX81189.1 hypothetical protein CEUSTIGMA_g8622.t1 [Chlamydomonas eustigma]
MRWLLGSSWALSAAATCASLHTSFRDLTVYASSSSPDSSVQTVPGLHRLDETEAKLKLVQVVFRHGARTPLGKHTDFWKDDPLWDMCNGEHKRVQLDIKSTTGEPNPTSSHNEKQKARRMPGGCFAGELTNLGHQQALELGQKLRLRYMEGLAFLKPHFNVHDVRCRSTNYDRTIKTLAGVLTGLYPDASQSIPVTTATDLDEIMYADTKSCPHLATFLALAKKMSSEAIFKDPEFGWARSEIKRIFGLDEEFFKSSWALTDVNDSMTSMKAHGKKIPEEMTEKLIRVVDRLATREFGSFVAPSLKDEHGHQVIKLSMGVLLHTLVSNMEIASSKKSSGEKNEAEPTPSLYLYSGHDSTVMPLLTSLGMEVVQWPPYASSLCFELWQLPTGEHVVKVLYNLDELHIPGCPPGLNPSLSKFTQDVVGPFLLSALQWGDACQVQVSHDSPQPQALSSMGDD